MINREVKKIFTKKSKYWEEAGKKHSIKLFQKASIGVPAYKDFLKKNKVDASKINTWQDFLEVPYINKDNYLRCYPKESLCWGGKINERSVFTSTSGSTGEPFYFPRSEAVDNQAAVLHELFLRYSSGDKIEPTLVIVAFGMGVWIGGLLTYKAFEISAVNNDWPISILTTGINKKEIFNALKNLSPNFKKTIIAGYPPFVKDLLDESAENGVDIKKINLKFVFAAETFTETFREYLFKKVGGNNLFNNFLHVYGSADIGAMAVEMPMGVLIKRLALKNKNFFNDIFAEAGKTPTLAQYNPLYVNFESVNEEILLTGDNILPLIRYKIGDRGGVFNCDDVKNKMVKYGIDLKSEVLNNGLEKSVCELPFVYVYERLDFSVTLYGVNIYPQIIKEALLDNQVEDFVSGKFTMLTKFDDGQDQYLEINVELKNGIKIEQDLEDKVKNILVKNLFEKSSEFKELTKHLGERSYPKVILWNYGDQKYFKSGVKQTWTKK